MAALVITYRDFRYVMTFLIQLWIFASAVVYPLSVVAEKYRFCYAVNPIVGMIHGFRADLLCDLIDWGCVVVSAAVIVLFLFVGLFYFRRTERRFADII